MRTTILALLPCLCALPAFAQDQPDMSPAKELQKLDRMIGAFTGKGTVWQTAGSEAGSWTAKSSAKKILGGHFIGSSTEIDLGPAMPTKLHFEGLVGYDRENLKFVSAGVSNIGTGSLTDIHWVDDDCYIVSNTLTEDGLPVVDRETIRFTDKGYSIKIDRAVGDGDFFTHVKGSFERAAQQPASAVAAVDASFMNAAPAPEMSKLVQCTGTFEVKGKMVPAPGAPEMAISGKDQVKALYGGQVLVSRVTGDPSPPMNVAYEAIGYMTWNPAKNCFDQFCCDNMGMICSGEGRFEGDDTLVVTSSTVMYGKPTVMRTLLHLDDEGKITGVTTDQITAGGKPQRTFDAKYTPAK